MDYKAPVESHQGQVREVTVGTGERAVKIGGENRLPYSLFDGGSTPNPPRFALEIWDMEPKDWPDWTLEPFGKAVSDPVEWARRCLDYGADLVCLRLVSTDPSVADAPADKAAETARRVAEALSVPLIVYGSGDDIKDAAVLPRVAAACHGHNLLLGPALKENYEVVAMAAREHGHALIAQTPLDINLMKELNIKLSKSFPAERIVIDPLSSALGYGMEYSFTIMERIKQTGVIHRDAMTQMPIIADVAWECWKTKEAKANREQGLLWEGIAAVSLLLAGGNVVTLRHPQTLKMVREVLG